jgi:MFS family permease
VLAFSGVGGLIPGTLFGVAVVVAPGDDTVSTTVGWMQQFSALGQFVGPPAVAWLVTQVGGWHWTWALTGACSVLGMATAMQLQRVWTRRTSAPQAR